MNRPFMAIAWLLVAAITASAGAQGQTAPAEAVPPLRPLAPELESALPPEQAWLNTDRPLRLAHELRGHVVLLDFWTHCCINCMHILPDLEYLEDKYADEPFVVIGVHTAKFDSEGERASIRDAVFRHHIRHPVLIDTGMALWKRYGVRAWPSFVLIGADGRLIGITSGEGRRELLDQAVGMAIEAARDTGSLARRRVEITADEAPRAATGLSYPGKVLAVPPDPARDNRGYVFVADSAHNRIVAAHWPDPDGHASLFEVYGSGEPGIIDAWARDASFSSPQGMAFDPALGTQGTLYVADTGNHAIRAIDLGTGRVMTLAGTGQQGADRHGGGRGRAQGLSSPWDLALSPDGRSLYVAMAGTHQLWTVDLGDGARAEAIVGGIGENLIDGPALDAMLAQPSGLVLSGDGRRVYFADAEASAVRLLDLASNRVGTIIGRGLFEFGDIDGSFPEARLQHCMGLAIYPTPEGERLLVADTYNDSIKLIHPFARTSEGFPNAVRRELPGASGLGLSEPGGLCYAPGSPDGARPGALFIADTNNHRVVMLDPASGEHRELILDPLTPPARAGGATAHATPFDAAALAMPVSVALAPDRPATLVLDAELPAGATVNAEAPVSVRVWRLPRPGERMAPRVIAQATLPGVLPARVEVAGAHDGALWLVELCFAWCEHGRGATCRPGEALWRVDVTSGESVEATLDAAIR